MKRWGWFGLFVAVGIAVALVWWWSAGAAIWSMGAVAAQGANLLANPSFEGPTMPQDDIGQLQIVGGWRVAWKENQCQKPDWALSGSPPDKIRRPELKIAPLSVDRRRVKEGNQSQCMFGFYSEMLASLQQTVNATTGAWYQASVYAQSWASENDDPTTNIKSDMYVLIGIDPEGDSDPWARKVVWCNWILVPPSGTEAGNWVLVQSLPVQARKNQITVFILADGRWASKHNDIYLDDAKLIEIPAPGGSIPQPTPAPLPTYTPYPTPQPRPTCEPNGECNCLTLADAEARWGWLIR